MGAALALHKTRTRRRCSMPALPEHERTPERIDQELDKLAGGQRNAKRKLALLIGNAEFARRHESIEGQLFLPRVILIEGPPGTGKTHLAQLAAELSGRPFVYIDATNLTQAGYAGKDAATEVGKIVPNANGDVKAAEHGIVFFDEVDKLGVHKTNGHPDVNGAGAQQTLLTLLQGTELQVGGKRLRTHRMLFFLAGAYEGLDLGDDPTNIPIARLVDPGGMIPQVADRIDMIARTQHFAREERREILVGLPNGALRKLKNTFLAARITLVIPDKTVDVLLDLIEGVSARRFQSTVMEHLGETLLYHLPKWQAQGVTRVEVPPEMVLDRAPPKVIIRSRASAPPPLPEPTPELREARRRIDFELAPNNAHEYWRKVEAKYPANVVLKAAAAIEGQGLSLRDFHDHLVPHEAMEIERAVQFVTSVLPARLKIYYEQAPDQAQEYWRKAERENSPELLLQAVKAIQEFGEDLQSFFLSTDRCEEDGFEAELRSYIKEGKQHRGEERLRQLYTLLESAEIVRRDPDTDLKEAREKIGYDHASERAKEYWRRVERENPTNVVLKLANSIQWVIYVDLEYYHRILDRFEEDVGAEEEFQLVGKAILARDRESGQKLHYITGETCTISGTYIFSGFVDNPSSWELLEADTTPFKFKRGDVFPLAGKKKRPAAWRRIRTGDEA
jgi:ATP-dependent Clp protease ATP-binding subunit ClpX